MVLIRFRAGTSILRQAVGLGDQVHPPFHGIAQANPRSRRGPGNAAGGSVLVNHPRGHIENKNVFLAHAQEFRDLLPTDDMAFSKGPDLFLFQE